MKVRAPPLTLFQGLYIVLVFDRRQFIILSAHDHLCILNLFVPGGYFDTSGSQLHERLLGELGAQW